MRLKYVEDLVVHLLLIQIDCYKDNQNTDIILNSLKLLFWYSLIIHHIVLGVIKKICRLQFELHEYQAQ